METIDAIKASMGGRSDAFGILFDRYSDQVYRVASRLLGSDTEAEDLVQDTFLSAWKKLHRFDLSASFPAWLYKIAVNKCYDELKGRKRRPRKVNMEEGAERALSALPDPETQLSSRETLALIKRLSEELTPKQRLAFVLIDLEDLSHEEATKICSLSRDSLKSNLYLARKKMADKLENTWKNE